MRYRAIQWATGAMGKATLRTMLDHPDIDIVGVRVYNPDKVGRDAGELARRPPTGVLATDDVDALLALDADVVVHVAQLRPYGGHDDELVQILESGKNVLALNGYSNPHRWTPERYARVSAACLAGRASLMGAGLNPGFIGEQLAVVASGACSEVDHVEIIEAADSREIRNPAYMFEGLGFGADPAAHDPNDPGWGPVRALNGMYEEVLTTIAERLGIVLDRVDTDHRLLPATRDIELPAGTVPKGTVSHTNWRWYGIAGGQHRLTMSINWFVETAHFDRPDPPLWQVRITGQPGVNVTVELAKHPEDRSRMSPEEYGAGGSVVNAIPHVVAAAPGIVVRPMATPASDARRARVPRDGVGGR